MQVTVDCQVYTRSQPCEEPIEVAQPVRMSVSFIELDNR